jgi:4,5-dihydroxyphthalate decarboxylase
LADLELTFAGLDYLDRTRALVDGSVRPEGISLSCLKFSPYELFARVAKGVEFDVAEMSFSTYSSQFSRGDRRYVAIPVFLSRHFRHGFIFVRGASGITKPEDLVGKRVGVPEYEMTAALWQRAILSHDYGVQPHQMRWFQGGEFNPGFIDRQELPTPAGVSIEFIPEDRTLHDMLAAGEIDALMCPHQPPALTDGSARVRRLFADYVALEQSYFARTRFFPIMHLTVIRRDLYEEQRWVARALFDAFVEAKRLGWQRLNELGALAVMLPWMPAELEQVAAIMGPDHWPYGFRDNYAILSAMCEYSFEQGLSQRRLEPEELFAPETHSI